MKENKIAKLQVNNFEDVSGFGIIGEIQKQKIILVDHNNFSQSIEGIEEAEVIEIIDHHNIGSIGTSMPINFRCMTVGATATMIYQMFVEKKVLIPKHIAGLLASAIISDTVLLTSPTTTPDDIFAVNELCKIAEIDLNKYGYENEKLKNNVFLASTKSKHIYSDVNYTNFDEVFVLFGKETKGLPEDLIETNMNNAIRIPMRENLRSLNLSNSVAIIAYEILRQDNFMGLQTLSNYFN